MKINYLDLFSGIGGFTLGLLNSGFEFEEHYYSEIDKYANIVYKKHFPNAINIGDINGINTSKIERPNIITFGFPCQDISIAGGREGISGQRSGLFFEAIRIINETKPEYFIFENVKGLFSSNKGKDFEKILQTISDIGYDGQWQLLNTKWVLPQNRERIYFIGHIRGRGRPEIFPIKRSDFSNERGMTSLKELTKNESDARRVYDQNGLAKTLKALGGGLGAKTGLYRIGITKAYDNITAVETSNCIDANYWKGLDNHQQRTGVMLTERRTKKAKEIRKEIRKKEGRDFSPRREKELTPREDELANCLTCETTKEGYILIPEATKKGYAEAKEGDSINLSVPSSKTRRGRVGKETAQTIDTNMKQYTLQQAKIRRLTPVECERLQGFPDNYTSGLSDTQRYKVLGNAVTVKIVELIGRKLIEQF